MRRDEMSSHGWARSASLLVRGVALVVVGLVVLLLALYASIRAEIDGGGGSRTNTVWVLIGSCVLIGGLVLLCVGLWQLATNVDLAAFAAARRLAQDETAAAAARDALPARYQEPDDEHDDEQGDEHDDEQGDEQGDGPDDGPDDEPDDEHDAGLDLGQDAGQDAGQGVAPVGPGGS
ncbi:hypothetical protein [Cellulomonas composti]|nr:hypothetical protein [Cellulomonas composti]